MGKKGKKNADGRCLEQGEESNSSDDNGKEGVEGSSAVAAKGSADSGVFFGGLHDAVVSAVLDVFPLEGKLLEISLLTVLELDNDTLAGLVVIDNDGLHVVVLVDKEREGISVGKKAGDVVEIDGVFLLVVFIDATGGLVSEVATDGDEIKSHSAIFKDLEVLEDLHEVFFVLVDEDVLLVIARRAIIEEVADVGSVKSVLADDIRTIDLIVHHGTVIVFDREANVPSVHPQFVNVVTKKALGVHLNSKHARVLGMAVLLPGPVLSMDGTKQCNSSNKQSNVLHLL